MVSKPTTSRPRGDRPSPGPEPVRPQPGPPIDPPPSTPPVTFDFLVSSLTVKNPRALETDTDYATIAAATLAPDGTQVGSYRPTSQYLGDLGKGKSIDRGMSLAAMDVPDGGFLALSFVVVNRGS